MFQFLHGTIKGTYDFLIGTSADMFQFLHGTIKGMMQILTTMYHTSVSIPTWYD